MALEAEDVRRFAEATERVQQLHEKMGSMQVGSGSGNYNLNLIGGGRYGLLVGFVSGGVLVASMMVGLWVGFKMATVDQQLFEIRADLKGVRAYINKGMATPPSPEKEKKDAQ